MDIEGRYHTWVAALRKNKRSSTQASTPVKYSTPNCSYGDDGKIDFHIIDPSTDPIDCDLPSDISSGTMSQTDGNSSSIASNNSNPTQFGSDVKLDSSSCDTGIVPDATSSLVTGGDVTDVQLKVEALESKKETSKSLPTIKTSSPVQTRNTNSPGILPPMDDQIYQKSVSPIMREQADSKSSVSYKPLYYKTTVAFLSVDREQESSFNIEDNASGRVSHTDYMSGSPGNDSLASFVTNLSEGGKSFLIQNDCSNSSIFVSERSIGCIQAPYEFSSPKWNANNNGNEVGEFTIVKDVQYVLESHGTIATPSSFQGQQFSPKTPVFSSVKEINCVPSNNSISSVKYIECTPASVTFRSEKSLEIGPVSKDCSLSNQGQSSSAVESSFKFDQSNSSTRSTPTRNLEKHNGTRSPASFSSRVEKLNIK